MTLLMPAISSGGMSGIALAVPEIEATKAICE